MDKKRRDELLALCEKATPGPWTQRKEEYDSHDEMASAVAQTIVHGGHVMHFLECEQAVYPALSGNGPTSKANAAFIAAARTALPEALDEIGRLREAVDIAFEWMNDPDPGNGDSKRRLREAIARVSELVDDV